MSETNKKLQPPRVINIQDLRRLAQKRLPRVVFDYLDGGAENEITLRENCRVFEDVVFRPKYAVPVSSCDLRTNIFGLDLAMPVILAPVGYSRLFNPRGELAAAAAAGDAGLTFTLSTISGHKLENVKAATKGPAWYQLYTIGGQAASEAALERARAAGYAALVVTVDTPVAGMRERDPRNGMKQLMAGSLLEKLPFVPNLMLHPAWVAAYLADGGTPRLENVVVPGNGPLPMTNVSQALADAVVTWNSLKWIRNSWPGPILIKGLLTAEDARRAVDEGASGVIVSNHGGRQLDSAPAALRALPQVVAAVGDRTTVLMDGGIRRGSDVVKALAMGAKAVLIGRAYAYGLAAAGQDGVARALEILRADIQRTLQLIGCTKISELSRDSIDFPGSWLR